jgi:hypothetical protein
VTDPARRLEIVRPAVPIDLAGAVLAESWSNDTWLTGGSVLRVCWRGDRERLVREAMLLGSLPAAVPHASVLATGHADDLTWMVLRRLPGERLDLARRPTHQPLEVSAKAPGRPRDYRLGSPEPGERGVLGLSAATSPDWSSALTISRRIGAGSGPRRTHLGRSNVISTSPVPAPLTRAVPRQ